MTTHSQTQNEIEAGTIVESNKGSIFVVIGFNNSIASEEHAMVKSYHPHFGAASGQLALPLSILKPRFDLMS